MKELLNLLSSILNGITIFKPNEAILSEKAERKDIRNKVRAKKAELKRIKLQKRIDKLNKKSK